MDKGGTPVPVGLVKVEGVFSGSSVIGHQAHVALAGDGTLLQAFCVKVKQAPDEGAPQMGVGVDVAEGLFVHLALVFLGMPFSLGRQAVLPQDGVQLVLGGVGPPAVLRKAHRPGIQAGDFLRGALKIAFAVPAREKIVGNQVGLPFVFHASAERSGRLIVVRGQIAFDGLGGIAAAGVFLVGQVVQLRHCLLGVGKRTAAVLHEFVLQTPETDGRPVALLADQLGQLGFRRVQEAFFLPDVVDQRDLRPDDDALFVAQVIEQIGLGRMGQAHRVGPHFLNQDHVLLVVGFQEGAAQASLGGMPVDAPERVRLAV